MFTASTTPISNQNTIYVSESKEVNWRHLSQVKGPVIPRADRQQHGRILLPTNASAPALNGLPTNFDSPTFSVVPRGIARLKTSAFAANQAAKASSGQVRAAHYRRKDAAINTLLREGYALVDEVDWSHEDPIIGVSFAEGGKLHTRASCLDSGALRSIRQQLNGCATTP
jgi:hypothetical protein